MKIVYDYSLDEAKERIAHKYTEDELVPLLLFRGNMDMGRAQALYKLTLLMMDAEVQSPAEIKRVTAKGRDLCHLTGLHEYSKYGVNLMPFLSRLISCDSVVSLEPRVRDYAYYVAENGRTHLYHLEPISRYARRSRRGWRVQKGERKKRRTKKDNAPAIPEFYPFVSSHPHDDCEMLHAIHEAVPKNLPEYWRQDICQDLIVAVLGNEIDMDDLNDSVPVFVKEVIKQYPTKYGPLSLDAPLWWDGDRTLMDVLVGDELR